jgi:histone deacetylase complex regulatory component SIN3
MFKNRLSHQIGELNSIKNIHSLKNWTEIANKNFYKALDIKGF